MSRPIDLKGKRFGKLTVIEKAGTNKHRKLMWKCKCDCGNYSIVVGQDLRRGKTSSCGICVGGRNIKHSLSSSRIYCIWSGMKNRCLNAGNSYYYRYGGRGITVYEEWLHDFQAFYDWSMLNGYRDDLTLDRKDNNKGYSTDNCRWITQKEQNRNKCNNRTITCRGITKILTDWAVILGIGKENLTYKLNNSELSESEVIENLLNKMEVKQDGGNKEE